ncbi:hypothetical protein F6P93_06295 [Escherichia coli]|nr:hypothetical protein F6P93_06295 [Escherichia coli]
MKPVSIYLVQRDGVVRTHQHRSHWRKHGRRFGVSEIIDSADGEFWMRAAWLPLILTIFGTSKKLEAQFVATTNPGIDDHRLRKTIFGY